MKRRARILALILLPVAAHAQSLDDKARDIEGKLIAPCCWSQPISQHYSQVADEMRHQIRQMLRNGKSQQQILDYYVVQYGERILASPRASGFNVLAYALPYFTLGLGLLVLIMKLRNLRTRGTRTEAAAEHTPVLESEYSKRVEQELRELK